MPETCQRDDRVTEMFEALLAHGADPILLTHPDGTVLRANAAACAALGWTEAELRRLGRAGLVVPGREVDALLASRARAGRVEGEIRFRRADGTTFPAEFTSTVVSGAGEPFTLVVFRDASARHAREAALREREERARVALDAARLGTWRHDLATGAFTLDARAAEHYGCREGTTTLEAVLERIVPEDRARIGPGIAESLDPARSAGRYAFDYRVALPSGEVRALAVQACVLFAGEGTDRRPIVTIGTSEDVTERRALEERVRESEERFRTAFHTLPDAVTITDVATGTFVAVNAGATFVTGWSHDEMVGRTAEELGLWHDGDRKAFGAGVEGHGPVRDFLTRLRRKDGEIRDVSLAARRLRAGGRELLLAVTRDVTPQLTAERERDAFQAQLRESQKLEAIGRLAGGIAHDFNNLLTVILNCGQLLRDAVAEGQAPALDDVQEIILAADRARDLTTRLLAFARRQVIEPVPIDLNAVLERTSRLLRRVLGEDVDLLLDPQRALWTVSIDPAQLEQVILNLAVNARDALPRGGRLLLETANVTLGAAEAARFPGARPGDWVKLTVQDSGVGMTREVRERAFEPFFTTKPAGKGTGLGLATVHGIVTQSGGAIHVESEPGYGTKIELVFPRVHEAPVSVPPPAVPAPDASGGARGTETVLAIEDDRRLREVIARTLRAAGYRVLTASGGQEAVEIAAAEPAIDMVVTDVVMVGMDGHRVVETIRARRPGLPALFVSGHPEDVILRRGVLQPGADLLHKPFTATDLLARVRAALDAARQGPASTRRA